MPGGNKENSSSNSLSSHWPDLEKSRGAGGTFHRQSSYLVGARPENEQVKGDGCEQIDGEPAFDVVLGNPAGLCHHLVVLVHVRRAQVDDYVHDEEHVHHQVGHVEGVARVAAAPLPQVAVLVQQEGGGVGREHGRVENQDEDNPVPESLEGAVVEQDPPCGVGHLQFILRQHIGLQGEYLGVENTPGCVWN